MERDSVQFHFSFAFSRRQLKALLALLLLAGLGYALKSVETMRLSTYYPAPAGVYKKIITTSQTILARDGGSVGIGTSGPLGGKLYVEKKEPGHVISAVSKSQTDSNYGINAQATGAGAALNVGGYFAAAGGLTNYALWLPDTFPVPGPNNYAIMSFSQAKSAFAGRVGLGTSSPQARLEVNNTLRLTPTDSPENPVEGALYYDKAAKTLRYHDGSGWKSLGGGDTLIGAEAFYKGPSATSIAFSKPVGASYAILRMFGGGNGPNQGGSEEDNEFMNAYLDFKALRTTGQHIFVGGNGGSYVFNYTWKDQPFGVNVNKNSGDSNAIGYATSTNPRFDFYPTNSRVVLSNLSGGGYWDQSYFVLFYKSGM